MNKREIKEFIRKMKMIGDEWTEEQVKDVYGECTLEEAFADRKASIDMFFSGIADILNN